jgi:hypothetical protein
MGDNQVPIIKDVMAHELIEKLCDYAGEAVLVLVISLELIERIL